MNRMFLVCLLLASKMFQDTLFTNREFARRGGLGLSELNALEVRLCGALSWDLTVPGPLAESERLMLEALARPHTGAPVVDAGLSPPATMDTSESLVRFDFPGAASVWGQFWHKFAQTEDVIPVIPAREPWVQFRPVYTLDVLPVVQSTAPCCRAPFSVSPNV